MFNEEFAERYGKNKKVRHRFNAAIREEIPGGSLVLELMEHVNHARQKTNLTTQNYVAILNEVFLGLSMARDEMVDDIKNRWKL